MYITIHYKTVFQNFQGPPMIFQNFQVLKCIKPKFTNFPGFQGGVRTLSLMSFYFLTPYML